MPARVMPPKLMGMIAAVTFVMAVLAAGAASAEDRAAPRSEWPELLREDFERHDPAHWSLTDSQAWRVEQDDANHVFSQFQQSQYETPVRSPFNRGIVSELVVSDFQLDVDLQSTARDYPHRSLCLFFGYQDPSHFYYVHFGQQVDDHANQVFLVNEAPRTKISTKTNDGTPWDHAWHKARIVRTVEDGAISVYFDDMESPAMTAVDKTFTWGRVGIGSFDDTGRFDNLVIHGVRATPPE